MILYWKQQLFIIFISLVFQVYSLAFSNCKHLNHFSAYVPYKAFYRMIIYPIQWRTQWCATDRKGEMYTFFILPFSLLRGSYCLCCYCLEIYINNFIILICSQEKMWSKCPNLPNPYKKIRRTNNSFLWTAFDDVSAKRFSVSWHRKRFPQYGKSNDDVLSWKFLVFLLVQ